MVWIIFLWNVVVRLHFYGTVELRRLLIVDYLDGVPFILNVGGGRCLGPEPRVAQFDSNIRWTLVL